ncbi:KAT8 regulatory NSL complex subunit 2 [Striga asiatica]|uniref:KAT8 regulatory NSL complex subunit 2 n=1 Tax=Striga asiatica TaxID=4170 RepID=A0A5A7P6X1_STRAF|nr:KAT8 regulatory NSL complex subunit 2 [Striga asiatica]
MPTANLAAAGGPNHHSAAPLYLKTETKPPSNACEMLDPSASSSSGPIRIDGSEQDATLSKSEFLTRSEFLNRRARRVKQLGRIYRDQYWALMEELKLKYREYYWEYGKGPFLEDEENERNNASRGDYAALPGENGSHGNFGVNGGNASGRVSGRCEVHGCKAKAMALTRFCHMHITSDAKQKLYESCTFSIKSSATGPILCGRPLMKSSVPSYCPMHFEKAEKHMVRALKKAGLNVSSTSKLTPKLHLIVAEHVRHIQNKRRAAKRANHHH